MTIGWALLIALGMAVVGGTVVLTRWRDAFPPLPQWTWRNIMALIALVSTVLGAAVLTAVTWWLLDQLLIMAKALIGELMRDPKARPEVGQVLVTIVDATAWGLKLLLAGVIVVLLSLGIAITPRKIVVNRTGAEMSGGDESAAPAAAQAVADSAQTTADTIKEATP
jgi:hypothetical protein